jgi:hypothetical protein
MSETTSIHGNVSIDGDRAGTPVTDSDKIEYLYDMVTRLADTLDRVVAWQQDCTEIARKLAENMQALQESPIGKLMLSQAESMFK